MEQAYFDARTFGWSPALSLNWSFRRHSTALAPRGQHVASLFCQHVAPKLSDGLSWDDHREAVADLMIETVDDHAPELFCGCPSWTLIEPCALRRSLLLSEFWKTFGRCSWPHRIKGVDS